MRNFNDIFDKPDDSNRAKPFWSLNHDLDAGKLKEQIRELREMGISGALFHSRPGLIAPHYLGEQWFNLVNEICEEAKAHDFTIWLYDEDRWPSGTAGGLVTSNPAHRQKRLIMKLHSPDSFTFQPGHVAAFLVEFENSQMVRFERIRDPLSLEQASSGWSVVSFELFVMPCTDWYNGGAYLDTLSHEAVQAFLESTHQKYADACGHHFGAPITVMFTDEPHHESVLAPTVFSVQNNSADAGKTYEFPWTSEFPEFFQEKYGYDLLDHLPLIVFDRQNATANKVRHDYHDCLTHLFVSAYSRQISGWASEHGLTDTGHIFWESPLNKMVSYVGSMLRFMEHMQMPGVDILSTTAVFTDGRNEYDSVKQCASVVNQFGKTHIMSETYACCGWEFTPEDMKRIGDWQSVLGVNCRCQSCFAYTIAHDGKRDFPPSYFHVPWQKMFANIEDYYARINAFVSLGKPLRRVLVLHPNETMWQYIKADWTEEGRYREVESSYEQLIQWMLEGQIDFDYGDEEIIARTGAVKPDVGNAVFAVSQAEYECVLVPDLLTLRNSTLELLKEFRAQGGTVVFSGRIPDHIEGEISDLAAQFASTCICVPHHKNEVLGALADFRVVQVSFEGSIAPVDHLLCSYREDENGAYLIVHSTDKDKALKDLSISVPASCAEVTVYDADPFTGKQKAVPSEWKAGTLSIPLELEALGLKLLRIGEPGEVVPQVEYECFHSEPCNRVTVSPDSQNICLLDVTEYQIGQSGWKKDYVPNADINIREHMGWPRRRFNMRQPWADPEWHETESVPVTARYSVHFDFIPERLNLVMEEPERFCVKINGMSLDLSVSEAFIDHALRSICIPSGLLKEGENVIETSIDYRKSDGLENIYLLGDFDIVLNGSAVCVQKKSSVGAHINLTENGSPFFYGSMTYSYVVSSKDCDKTLVSVPEWKGACCSVRVNGREAGDIAFKPYELDVTDWLQDGDNQLEITLFSTSRNLFGPFHCSEPFRGEGWTDPRDYNCPEFDPSRTYTLFPYGIMAPPVIRYLKQKESIS